MIYTIGYGNRSFDLFRALLQRYSITALVDTRSRPYSRHNPNYNKTALSAHLKSLGIEYYFLGHELGGRPDDPILYTDGFVDYAKISASAGFQSGIRFIVARAQQDLDIAVLCSELRPENCHRSRLLAPALLALGQSVEHIDERGEILSHNDVILRWDNLPFQPPLV